ncbi:hypothetical protein Kpol_2002p10 [Vanderwaltozyma polyspora DSM 70294]|uniref:Antisense of depressing factor protein 1 n=1 Tax=Vanderwaltozyma polyspora (strain ATCC 22028 / DSM 70294 / BCRC 21397 / CBS 2163 / NBRC 10782 / NRRL Y-8283 / UCD 57-17) TaxID=436907 RepID=A7TFC6_VANPO|nr:uncharacterized protein Kpol_2002p10 [Vanderwaltozyma polyspora DSM 70294]EDO18940.1 hypothetical protein Kpol_2002p10 [Vanderwaltozyma polyspora DSM 70294]
MAKSSVSMRKKGNVGKKSKRKNVISQSEKKRNKIKMEKINKEGILPSDILQLNNETRNGQSEGNKERALESQKLQQDNVKDRETIAKIEASKKETDDSMLKQIELMTGFSL